MKRNIKIMGIDDAPFSFQDKTARVVGVVIRAPNYLEGVLHCSVSVDGLDSAETIAEMVNSSGHRRQLKGIMVSGACVGGFNVVDIEKLSDLTGIGVMTLTNNRPRENAVRGALKKHFLDWEARVAILEKGKKITIGAREGPRSYQLYARYAGMGEKSARGLVEVSRVRGALPEPIRMAHIIASSLF
jgi:hypothetical protein